MPSKQRIIRYVVLPFLWAGLQTPARCEANAAGSSLLAQSSAPGADGYGVNDCNADCAKVVADAFCKAHGHTAANAFGPSGDGVFISCE